MRGISPSSTASAIRTRTGAISARRKSGRPPATRTSISPTAGSAATSTTPARAATRPSRINIGPRLPQAFSSHTPTGISLENPDSYRFIGSGQNDDETLAYRSMYTPNPDDNVFGDASSNSGGERQHGLRHGDAAKRPERARLPGAHLDGCAGQLRQNPRHRGQDARTRSNYPYSGLANNLQLVARLIAGGLPTRVFYVSQGGYDTHTSQRERAGRPAARNSATPSRPSPMT